MKQFKKVAILAALGLISVSAAKAESYGDLIVGFTTQSGSDFLYDIGSLVTGSGQTSPVLFNGETWSAATLGITAGTSYSWGVVGDISHQTQQQVMGNNVSYDTLFSTSGAAQPLGLPSSGAWASVDAGVTTLTSDLPGGNAGFAPNTGSSVSASAQTSWATETISGALTTDYHNSYLNPNTAGTGSSTIYAVNDNGSSPVNDGTFTFNSTTGTLTYNVSSVPEPATYGLFAGAGMLLLGLRRQFSRKA